MTVVVVLSWDAASRRLEYVEVNDGLGGAPISIDVSAESAEWISEQLSGLLLPYKADLDADGDLVLLDASGGMPAARCAVKAGGPPGALTFELRPRVAGAEVIPVEAASLGVTDPDDAMRVRVLDYLYVANLEPPGCWVDCEGGVDAWLAAKRLKAESEEANKWAKKQARQREAEADSRFVNPYTFVAFPGSLARCAPGGHLLLGDGRLSGTFTVTWEFASPFQAPDGATGTTPLRLPGSSVKGAVRSVHEALAGGCLRVFDEEFVPSYRDHAATKSADWKLAQVRESTGDGQPQTVRLCDEVVWADARKLRSACNGSLRTGSLVTIRDEDIPAEANSLGRKELRDDAQISGGGEWVVLVTDAGTRSVKDDGTWKYFLACGKLGERTVSVTEGAWSAFRVAVAGAGDLSRAAIEKREREARERRKREGRDQRADSEQEEQPTAEVVFRSERPGGPIVSDRIGRRRVITGRLWQDDVIWVRTAVDHTGALAADELSLARIWRHPGWPLSAGQAAAGQGAARERWAAGTRIPPGLRDDHRDDVRACRDPDWLCPTCRVFGSADPDARGSGDPADQRAYAGHVRFGDARSAGPVELTEIIRAPMGAPRPGAGQFYLSYTDASPAREGHRPTREWGSDPDATQPRRLRGRKFYWHADPAAQDPPRHIARQHQRDRAARRGSDDGHMLDRRQIAQAGTRLEQKISFDNLTDAEVGGLLAALGPGRVLDAPAGRRLLTHLGGGKPLGLGSCTATVSDLRVWNAASRYGGGPDVVPDEDRYLREFVAACSGDITGTWPALAAVLAEGTVDARRVWYPPGAHWSDQARRQKDFDEPFAFFKGSSGMFLKDKQPRPLVRLPEPDQPDQSLPIVTKADLR